MPRIFDNIDLKLLPTLQETLQQAKQADFCVGYFNLRGWRSIDKWIEQFSGGDVECCRLVVGMQKLPYEQLRSLHSLTVNDDAMDSPMAARLRKQAAEEFREQLTIGAPNNEDEMGLRRLSQQLKSSKVKVKLFLRHPLHAKLYLVYPKIPHPNLRAVGFLGSSNLTISGLRNQGELNIDVLDHDAIEKLEKWFGQIWQDNFCLDISQELIKLIDESWAREDLISPYHIYLKIAYHLSQEARTGLSEYRVPREFRDRLFDFQIAERGGFDAIIANPPWEVFKPNAKEFFAQYSDLVTKKKMDIKEFEKKQKELLQDEDIAVAWANYQSQFPYVSAYFRSAEQYKNQISIINGKKAGTDINLYKLFLESCFNLLKPSGECGIVIPSGIYTDLGCKQLREMLFGQTQVTGLFCFENRKEIFEGVHRSFKFVVFTFEKGNFTKVFPSAFMRLDVQDLISFPSSDDVLIDVDLVRKLSPESLSVMEFRSNQDIIIVQKMSKFPLLGERTATTWNLKLSREFDMTNDSYLFKQSFAQERLVLYEGKMIHQFIHEFAKPRYWVDEKEARKALIRRNESDTGQILDYQQYRLAFRDVARSTDMRTMIAAIIPPMSFAGNTAIVSLDFVNKSELLFAVSTLNSFVCDFVIRQKVSAHCNMFYIYQTPVPRLTKADRPFQKIVERAAKLICTTPEFDDLAAEVGLGSHTNGITDEVQRAQLRAELDGIIAHLYHLTETEFAHILQTFPIVPEATKIMALNAYRDVERGLI